MYYLDEKQFKPAMILFGILFIPSIIGLLIFNIVNFEIGLFILLLAFLFIYIGIILIVWKTSKRREHYLLLNDEGVEIVFYDSLDGKKKLELSFCQIKKIDYYRINSLEGWLVLFSFIYPKCVYITYTINGEEWTKFIGYMDYKDIKGIAKNKIMLKIH